MDTDFSPPRPVEASPVVVHYCATFLKPEMLHIHRQITAIRDFRSVVFTQKRENAGRFPFEPVRAFPRPPTRFLRRFWQKQLLGGPIQLYASEATRIITALRDVRASLIHVYFGHIGVYLLPFIRRTPVPVVVSFHGADAGVDMEKPRHQAAMRELLERAGRVLVRSDSLSRELQALGCDPGKLRLHRTGIPLDKFPFKARAIPPDGKWQLVQACRLIEKKGLRTSLRAFSKFAAAFPESTFTIAGEGPLLSPMQDFTHDLGLTGRVRFAGFLGQEKLRALFDGAHFFLHPSELGPDRNQEGVPNSMLEAMATGLPAFSTRHGGIPEAIEPGVSGVLVHEGDADALASELLATARNPARYARLSAGGAQAVAAKFNLSSQVRVLEAIYAGLLLQQAGG